MNLLKRDLLPLTKVLLLWYSFCAVLGCQSAPILEPVPTFKPLRFNGCSIFVSLILKGLKLNKARVPMVGWTSKLSFI